MTIYVLFGVPGAGKTYTYERQFNDVPKFDVADVYRKYPGTNWDRVTRKVARLAMQHDHAVIEGMFLPQTPSRSLLEMLLRGRSVMWIHVHAPYEICKHRIISREQDNEEICLKILDLYYPQAAIAWEENDGSNYSLCYKGAGETTPTC